MDANQNPFDIVEEAAEVAHRYLELIEADVESREAQRSGKFVCSCANCRTQRRDTLQWVHSIHEHDPEPSTARTPRLNRLPGPARCGRSFA